MEGIALDDQESGGKGRQLATSVLQYRVALVLIPNEKRNYSRVEFELEFEISILSKVKIDKYKLYACICAFKWASYL